MALKSATFLTIVCALAAYSQTGTGNIRGTVKDATGAILPGTKVTATHTQTARETRTVSNEAGLFVIPSVPMGRYTVSVEAAGMEPGIWNLSASLFKAVRLNERFTLRFNTDFFNVLNRPGLGVPASATGIISTQTSAQEARNLQLTLRLSW